jgi:hypothetical protein
MQANPGIGASGVLQTLSGSQPDGGVAGVPAGTGSLLAAWEEGPLAEEELAEEDELLEEEEALEDELAEGEGGPPEGVGRDFAPGREMAPGLNRENGPPGLNRENGPPGLDRAESSPGTDARASAPGRVGRLTITQNTDSQITVRWPSVSPAPEQVQVTWQIRGNASSEQDVIVSGGTREVVISGLQARTPYVITVVGVNSDGGAVLRGQATTETFMLTPSQQPAPQPPAEQQRQPGPPAQAPAPPAQAPAAPAPAPQPAPSRPRPPAPQESVEGTQEETNGPGGGRGNAPGQNR